MLSTVVELSGRAARRGHGVDTTSYLLDLHSRWTVILLSGCAVLVCAKEHFGGHIHCLAPDNVHKVIEDYCFWTGTYISADEKGIYPGVGTTTKGGVIKISYYQWVPYFLMAQAGGFYLTRYLWKWAEGGRVAMFVKDIRKACEDNKIPTSEFLQKVGGSRRIYLNRDWGFWRTLCDLISACVVFLQILAADYFLQSEFLFLGVRIYLGDDVRKTFPRVTKCHLASVGPSGSNQLSDALCAVPLNALHEKIFAFLWAWYAGLLLVSCLTLFYKTISCCRPCRNSKSRLDPTLGSRLSCSDLLLVDSIRKNLPPKDMHLYLEALKHEEFTPDAHWRPEKTCHPTLNGKSNPSLASSDNPLIE